MIAELLSRRLILVTGKGGVGKSTISAALALTATREGRRVVICEVDEPSAIAPLLGGDAGHHVPEPAGHGVHLTVLSPDAGLRSYIADRIGLAGLVDLALDHPAVSRFFRAAPGFAEMGVLYAIHKLLEERRPDGRSAWDHVIVDLPASGHALAMLSAPATGRRVFLGGPVRALCESIEDMLEDPALTACALVTLPEELPVNEAVDLSEKLRALKLHVRALIASAVPPDPLSAEERRVLERLPDGPLVSGALTGARRAERAHATLARLARELGDEAVEIPFLSSRGRELIPAVADALAAELERERASGHGPASAVRV